MAKEYIKLIKPRNGLKSSYDIIKKIITDGKMKLQKDKFSDSGFYIECKEPTKITSYSTSFIINSEFFNDTLTIKFNAFCKMPANTDLQVTKSLDFLISNFELYDNI
jgi:hypothetical protein